MAHARRKFHELWANHGSPIGERALKVPSLYGRSSAKSGLGRQTNAKRSGRTGPNRSPMSPNQWLRSSAEDAGRIGHRQGDRLQPQTLEGAGAGSSTTGELPIDNNWVENQIRPIALGRATTGCSPAACARANAPQR